ncbi:MAG: hypothetical protein ACXWC4_00895 [Telluria sp.]
MTGRILPIAASVLLLGVADLFCQNAATQEPSVAVVPHPARQHRLRLVAVRIEAYARDGRLLMIRELDGNGRPPAFGTSVNLNILPGRTADCLQAFEMFSVELDLFRLHFELLFIVDDHAAAPVPFDADGRQELDVFPQDLAFQAFCAPLDTETVPCCAIGSPMSSSCARQRTVASWRRAATQALGRMGFGGEPSFRPIKPHWSGNTAVSSQTSSALRMHKLSWSPRNWQAA